MTEQELRSIFAENLKRILSERGKTQTDLVDHLNVSKSTVSFWCNGQKMPRMNKIDEICKFLNVRRSMLLEPKESISDDEEILQAIHDQPGMRIMFDVNKHHSSEDVLKAVEIVKAFYRTKDGGDVD